jgi:2-deoxy-D-gluconate 3-dehydrogenase
MTSIPALQQLTDLTGKTAVITGGAMGIGHGIACRLGEAGARVVLADLDAEAAAASAKQLQEAGVTAWSIGTDVSDEVSAQEMIRAASDLSGGVDILVNNAGIFPRIRFMSLTAADFDRVIAVNLRGVFLSSKAAAKEMISQGRGGRIINITSIDALHPSSVGLAPYDASEHGVWGLTKTMALDLAPHRIWVNAIAPGAITTPGVVTQSADPETNRVDRKRVLDALLANIPMGRMGVPDDIGRAALFLASEMSSYMTGSQIVVDGGVLLR